MTINRTGNDVLRHLALRRRRRPVESATVAVQQQHQHQQRHQVTLLRRKQKHEHQVLTCCSPPSTQEVVRTTLRYRQGLSALRVGFLFLLALVFPRYGLALGAKNDKESFGEYGCQVFFFYFIGRGPGGDWAGVYRSHLISN